jgi:hypothetical protein
VIVHVPAFTVVAVLPDTVHTDGVLEVSVTGRSESAEADRVTLSLTLASRGWSKVIVCDFCPGFRPAGFTWNERGTSAAGA